MLTAARSHKHRYGGPGFTMMGYLILALASLLNHVNGFLRLLARVGGLAVAVSLGAAGWLANAAIE